MEDFYHVSKEHALSPYDMEYTLNGGDDMKLWVNMTLSNATQRIKNDKYAKKAAGISNAFIKPHEKDRQNSNPTKVSVAKPNTSGSMTKNVQDDNAFKMEGKEKRKIIFDLKGLIELKV